MFAHVFAHVLADVALGQTKKQDDRERARQVTARAGRDQGLPAWLTARLAAYYRKAGSGHNVPLQSDVAKEVMWRDDLLFFAFVSFLAKMTLGLLGVVA